MSVEYRQPKKDRKPLSPRQQEVYDVIVDYFRERGMAPTRRELQRLLKGASLSITDRHINALEVKGWLYRPNDGGARNLQLTVAEHTLCPACRQMVQPRDAEVDKAG